MTNNIRQLRTRKGLTIRELADRMSEGRPDSPVHFTTVAKIERSQRRLTLEWAELFASALGVEVDQLDSRLSSAPTLREVPVLGLVAAGRWQEAIEQAQEHLALAVEEGTFALEIKGDSMDRVAPEGGYALVNPRSFDLLDGAFYVVMNDDGEATFKQYRANPARLEPCSTNPGHETIVLGRQPFSVVGRVGGVYRNLA